MILGLDELFAALLYKEIAVNNPVPKVTMYVIILVERISDRVYARHDP